MNGSKVILACLLALVFSTTQATADVVTPTNVTFSTEFAAAANLINGSGLGPGDFKDKLHDNDENNMWQSWGDFEGSGTSIGAWVEFELDQAYDLANAYIWQYNGLSIGPPIIDATWRETEDIDISVAPNLLDPLTSLGTTTLAAASALDPVNDPIPTLSEPVQIVGMGGVTAQRVRITIETVYDQALATSIPDWFAGLSEVRFVEIPEPATLGLAIGALSISLGLMRRRRKRG